MNERALVAMSSVLPPPKKGEMVTVQLRFIVDGLPNENNEYVEWVLVALDGEAFDTKLRKHLEHRYKLKDIDRLDYSGVNEQEIGQEDVGVLALPPPRCMTEFRAYIAALQSNAVPGSEQRAASTRAFIYIGKYRKI